MKASIVIGACLVGLALGLIVFWKLPTDAIAPPSGETTINDASGELIIQADRNTEATHESFVSDANGPEESSVQGVIDSQLAKRQKNMADGIYQLAGSRIVQRLTDSGLALSDSEGIARQYAANVAQCAIASLTAEATRQSISVDELLRRLTGAVADGSNPFNVIDRSSVEAYAAPCEADAMQRAGISIPPDVQQLSDEEIGRLRECIEAYSNSDIADRETILEICAQEVLGD